VLVLLAGAPRSGKSSAARRLVERLGYDAVCIDDLVAVVRAVITVASHPIIHAMTGIDYREYHIHNTGGATRRMRGGESGRPSNQ
jgi:2-phosphoglycerate kinase